MTEKDADPSTLERLTPVTFALLGASVLVFVLADRFGPTGEVKTLVHFGAVERYHVWLGEGWRLLTPMFLHLNLAHLVWNGYALAIFGRHVERALGPVRFPLLYVLGGIGGAAASVVGHDVVSACASAAGFAITGAVLVVLVRRAGSVGALWDDGDTKRMLVSIVVWCAIGLWLAVDNWAHAGGFVVGVVLTLAMTAATKAARRRTFGLFAASFVALVAFALRPWWTPSTADADTMTWYATEYYAGGKLEKDFARASRFALRACGAGSANACALQGFMYAKGDAVARDDAKAASYFRQGCDGKSSFGCAALGRVTMLGLGVAKDPVKANEYFSQACDLGQADGCAGYGISLYQGTGVVADKTRGLDIIQRACVAGSAIACQAAVDPDAPPQW